jgi:hypothetical protein
VFEYTYIYKKQQRLACSNKGARETHETSEGGVAYACAILAEYENRGWKAVMLFAAWEEIMIRDILYDVLKRHSLFASVHNSIEMMGGAAMIVRIIFALMHIRSINAFYIFKVIAIFWIPHQLLDITHVYDVFGIYACILLHFTYNYIFLTAIFMILRKVVESYDQNAMITIEGCIPFVKVLAGVSKKLGCEITRTVLEQDTMNSTSDSSSMQQFDAYPTQALSNKYGSRLSSMCKMVSIKYVEKHSSFTEIPQEFSSCALTFPACLFDIYACEKQGLAPDDICRFLNSSYTLGHASLLVIHALCPDILRIMEIKCPYINMPHDIILENLSFLCTDAEDATTQREKAADFNKSMQIS